ncbi:hypothetical protein PTKIN_Ptkin06aG0204000 [Pterospermum kingtungense]
MHNTLQFKSQFLHFQNNVDINPFLESTFSLQSFSFSSKSPIFTTSPWLSRKTQIPKPTICARKSKRRYGSERSTKLVLELVSILASNLKILPQPLDLVVQNLVAGDGEGLGFLNGFKGLGLRGNEAMKWIKETRVCSSSSMMQIVKRESGTLSHKSTNCVLDSVVEFVKRLVESFRKLLYGT